MTPSVDEQSAEIIYHIDRMKREITVLRAERDHARAIQERIAKLLRGIHALLYPPPVTTADGRTWVFRPKDPDPHVVLQELSDRIRDLPNALFNIEDKP